MSEKEHAIVTVVEPRGPSAEQFHTDRPEDPAVGKWYWLTEPASEWEEDAEGVSHKRENYDPTETVSWLGCLIEMGSNYAKIEGVPKGGSSKVVRVHLDAFFKHCKFEPNPDAVIDHEVSSRQKKVNLLMGKVVDITRRLAINPDTQALPSGSETRALATIGAGNQPIESYKTALVHAKEEELPDLFKRIKNENQNLANWMSAKLIPLQAQAAGLKPAIKAIEHRLFSVELYAGLSEYIEQVKDGEPAALTEKIHLFQRRCYMDEECLAQYETGGMDFKNIRDFDKWITRPSNLDRLLPFPRTIVAFRVRRFTKEREFVSISEYFKICEEAETDKYTYLYIRNGNQVYRMHTSIEFGEDLFPDADQHILNSGGPIWANKDHFRSKNDGINGLISDNEYQGIKERYKERLAEWRKTPRSKRRSWDKPRPTFKDYRIFNKANLYYDDIAKYLAEKADEHNRLVLVLQGLLDRSPVLHPHPAWSLWDGGSFREALELVYDNARAFTTGDKPDFEAYRTKLNASITAGSITVGQDLMWAADEADKEDKRRMERGDRGGFSRDYYRPHGNPGPGVLAYVVKVNKKDGTATFAWNKRRNNAIYDSDAESDPKKMVACKLTTEIENLFNVSAYKPGDFKQFWNDPRTRADYLKWAWLMLAAEEYHAGNREVAKVKLAPPKQRTGEGSHEYQTRKRNKALVGKAVRLRSSVTTTKGDKYAKDTPWRVTCLSRGRFTIQLLKDDGSGTFAASKGKDKEFNFERYHRIGGMSFYDLIIDSAIPAEKKPERKVEEPVKPKVRVTPPEDEGGPPEDEEEDEEEEDDDLDMEEDEPVEIE